LHRQIGAQDEGLCDFFDRACRRCVLASGEALSEEPTPEKGLKFALLVFASCHVVSRHQPYPPVLRKPAQSFDEIERKPTTTAQWLRTFLTTTHVTVENSNGMPNPQLADYQIEEVSTTFLVCEPGNDQQKEARMRRVVLVVALFAGLASASIAIGQST
jgi:hypothetical protein